MGRLQVVTRTGKRIIIDEANFDEARHERAQPEAPEPVDPEVLIDVEVDVWDDATEEELEDISMDAGFLGDDE